MTTECGFFTRTNADSRQKWKLQEFNTIGSGTNNSLVIAGTQDRQARIERNGDLLILRDLRTGQTKLNGVRILEAPLADGDSVEFGDLSFSFHISDPEASEKETELSLKSANARWQQQLKCIPSVARSMHPVLFLGESGTGKERLARAIHDLSARRNAPYITVNCSALSESLIESELFGHLRGSFTGATNDRKGAFETARNGTLFLDEIGDFPLHLQPKLLRALENHEIRPVGSDRLIQTDVRIVAATHQNLAQKVARGEFRADLFYRLNVVTFSVPNLKERFEDFDHILFDLARSLRVRFSHDAILELKKHQWPGNIRELRNTVARASALFGRENVTAEMTPQLIDVISPVTSPFDTMVNSDGRVPVMKEIERDLILRRLIANNGNQRQTARELGMPKSTLHDRLRFYNVNLSDLLRKGTSFLPSINTEEQLPTSILTV